MINCITIGEFKNGKRNGFGVLFKEEEEEAGFFEDGKEKGMRWVSTKIEGKNVRFIRRWGEKNILEEFSFHRVSQKAIRKKRAEKMELEEDQVGKRNKERKKERKKEVML